MSELAKRLKSMEIIKTNTPYFEELNKRLLVQKNNSNILFLLDFSTSMNHMDSGVSRVERLYDVIKQPEVPQDASVVKFATYLSREFSVREFNSRLPEKANGVTNLHLAFENLDLSKFGRIVLVTDGEASHPSMSPDLARQYIEKIALENFHGSIYPVFIGGDGLESVPCIEFLEKLANKTGGNCQVVNLAGQNAQLHFVSAVKLALPK